MNTTHPPNRTLAHAITLLAVLGGAAALGCSGSKPETVAEGEAGANRGGEASTAEPQAHHDAIRLNPEELAQQGVTLAAAGAGTIDASVELSGVIRPNGDRLAHIVPRFAGIAREVRRTIGDTVKAGDVLAVVESSGSLARYELQTMIDGVIIERHITLGEAVETSTQAFVVADLRTVWVDFSAFQRDLSQVRAGQTVRISAQHFGEGQADVEAKIMYVTPVVDEATRTATVRAMLPNPVGSWRPGMFVTGKVIDAKTAAVAVPEGALQNVGGRETVFVATSEGLQARAVTVGRRGETRTEILTGLAPGERYAAAGSFLLKAELGKGEAEHAD